jgi:hypothetical protein
VLMAATASGNPTNTALETINCATTPATGWMNFNFSGTTTLTPGAEYFAVFENSNATPASNYVAWSNCTQDTANIRAVTSSNAPAWILQTTTNSGGAWASATNGISGIRVSYADGTYDGMPVQTYTSSPGNLIYSTRECGIQFQLPWTSSLTLNVKGMSLYLQAKIGSPTNTVFGKLYTGTLSGTTPLASTLSSPFAISGTVMLEFANVVAVPGNSLVTLTLAENTNSDSSSNAYRCGGAVWDTDANSLPLLPFGNATKEVYYNGSSWALGSPGTIQPFSLNLDSVGGEFTVAGGLVLNPGMEGGLSG